MTQYGVLRKNANNAQRYKAIRNNAKQYKTRQNDRKQNNMKPHKTRRNITTRTKRCDAKQDAIRNEAKRNRAKLYETFRGNINNTETRQ